MNLWTGRERAGMPWAPKRPRGALAAPTTTASSTFLWGRKSPVHIAALAFTGIFLYMALIKPFYNQAAERPPMYDTAGVGPAAGLVRSQEGAGCLEVGRLIKPSRASAAREGESVIPLLATNLDFDTEKYLTRLMPGWNYTARHKLIVSGGCDKDMRAEVEELQQTYQDLTVYQHPEPLGCAAGWNKILEYMLNNADVDWAMIFNVDIFIPPEALRKLSAEIWEEYHRDPLFCRGIFEVTAGQDAVVFVMTRHGLETLGLFDENIYPAYFEDFDMDLRQNRSTDKCSPIVRFKSATMHHGPLDGTEYISGTSVARERMRASDPETKAAGKLLSRRIEIGFHSSQTYLAEKWGCDVQDQERCEYDRPFNNPALPVSYWRLDWKRRRCILETADDRAVCDYTLNRALRPQRLKGDWSLWKFFFEGADEQER